MNRIHFVLLLCLFMTLGVHAQRTKEKKMEVNMLNENDLMKNDPESDMSKYNITKEQLVFPLGQPNTAYAKYFIGNSYIASIASGEGKLPVHNVTFEPKCRNNWHIHNGGGQILICVAGRGWYQEWGKPAQELKPGDTVDIPAGVKHWHGAAKDSWFQHIALSIPAENGNSDWLEAVSDEEYEKLK